MHLWTCWRRSISLLTSSSSSENIYSFITISELIWARFSKCFRQNSKSSWALLLPLLKCSFYSFKAAIYLRPSSTWWFRTRSVFYAWARTLEVSLFFITSDWVAFWKWMASLLYLFAKASASAISVWRSLIWVWASRIRPSRTARSSTMALMSLSSLLF